MSRLITYREASALLKIPVGTLQWMVHEEKIPHVRLGPRTVRFEPEVLTRWIEDRRVG